MSLAANRSRNGCKTCKAKRIKCDERKPSCVQCHERNIECGGYKKMYQWQTLKVSSFAPKTAGADSGSAPPHPSSGTLTNGVIFTSSAPSDVPILTTSSHQLNNTLFNPPPNLSPIPIRTFQQQPLFKSNRMFPTDPSFTTQSGSTKSMSCSDPSSFYPDLMNSFNLPFPNSLPNESTSLTSFSSQSPTPTNFLLPNTDFNSTQDVHFDFQESSRPDIVDKAQLLNGEDIEILVRESDHSAASWITRLPSHNPGGDELPYISLQSSTEPHQPNLSVGLYEIPHFFTTHVSWELHEYVHVFLPSRTPATSHAFDLAVQLYQHSHDIQAVVKTLMQRTKEKLLMSETAVPISQDFDLGIRHGFWELWDQPHERSAALILVMVSLLLAQLAIVEPSLQEWWRDEVITTFRSENFQHALRDSQNQDLQIKALSHIILSDVTAPKAQCSLSADFSYMANQDSIDPLVGLSPHLLSLISRTTQAACQNQLQLAADLYNEIEGLQQGVRNVPPSDALRIKTVGETYKLGALIYIRCRLEGLPATSNDIKKLKQKLHDYLLELPRSGPSFTAVWPLWSLFILCITSPSQSEQLALKSGIMADLYVASRYSNVIPVLEAISIAWHLNAHKSFMHEQSWWEEMLQELNCRLSLT